MAAFIFQAVLHATRTSSSFLKVGTSWLLWFTFKEDEFFGFWASVWQNKSMSGQEIGPFSSVKHSMLVVVVLLAACRPSVQPSAMSASWPSQWLQLVMVTRLWWEQKRPARAQVPVQPLVQCQTWSQLHKWTCQPSCQHSSVKAALSPPAVCFWVKHVAYPQVFYSQTLLHVGVTWFVLTSMQPS